MQWPIVRGVYTDAGPEWRQSLPVNLTPVPIDTGVAQGYLRPAEGIIKQGDGFGASRGGIVWNGVLYRVIGSSLYSIGEDGLATVIGTVGATGPVQMAYSFDYLAIASGGFLWLYDGTALTKVVDPDIGTVQGVIWVDGYFMTTDGEFLVVTELTDPFSVNPLKYGSSEADPDPVIALLKLRNEAYALNRNTIEVFTNVGGDFFPFQRIEGAQVQRGAVGPSACCVYQDAIAFLGGGRNEAPSVYLAANGQSKKIATREVDKILSSYTEAELARAKMSERIYEGHMQIILWLDRDTLVYDGGASETFGFPIWTRLSTSMDGVGPWLADTILRAYDKWTVCHPVTGETGYLSNDVFTHWGETVNWEFSVIALYNEGRAAIIHTLELVAVSGRDNGTIGTQYSTDGREWSNPQWVSTADRNARIQWRRQGLIRNWRVQKFFGSARIAPTRLEAQVEGLLY